MTHRRRLSFLLPLLALAALSLLLTPSIFTPGKMVCNANDALHFWVRLHEFSWLFDRGVVWPRWGPNLSSGYGYPVFHYYGSLSLYPVLLLNKLGFSMLAAMQAGFWLTFPRTRSSSRVRSAGGGFCLFPLDSIPDPPDRFLDVVLAENGRSGH